MDGCSNQLASLMRVAKQRGFRVARASIFLRCHEMAAAERPIERDAADFARCRQQTLVSLPDSAELFFQRYYW